MNAEKISRILMRNYSKIPIRLLFRFAIMQNSDSSSYVPPLNFSTLLGDKIKHPTALKMRISSKLSLTEMAESVPTFTRLSSGIVFII